MFRMTLSAFAAGCFLLLGSSVLAQTGPPRHPPQPKILGPAKWVPSTQEVFAAYWTLEPGWSTQLEMRNNVRSHELTVTPILRASTGEETALAAVTIAPHHVVSVDLRTAALNSGIVGHTGSFGFVAFRFEGLSAANLFAAAIVRREGRPIDFHFDALPAGPKDTSGGMEGMW